MAGIGAEPGSETGSAAKTQESAAGGHVPAKSGLSGILLPW
jgi:hypothetical protein